MESAKKPDWWSDDRFWTDFGPLMFDERRWKDASTDIDGILAMTGAAPPQSILDVGCGPGRHAEVLSRRGFAVTGIDLQDGYLAQAAERTAGISPAPVFLKADMREYEAPEPFEGALSLFQTIGYLDDPAEDLKLCRRIRGNLADGGWLVMEMDGKEATALNFQERTWLERDGRTILLEYAAEGAWDRLYNRWMFRDADGSWHEYAFSYRLYSAVELGGLLEEAGFASIDFFGGMDGRPYDHRAERLVALARGA